jgi:CspA family cold shock protein
MKHQGIVKWFNESRGFGFIESEGQEYFVHYSGINTPGFKTLKDGQKVSFESTKRPKGLTAIEVEVIY